MTCTRSCPRGTDNVEAYLKVIQAREAIYRQNIEGIAMARKLSEEAVAIDPNYSTAYCCDSFYPYPGYSFTVAVSHQNNL